MTTATRDSLTTGYRVSYSCGCGHEWRAVWSCACDDKCSDCGASVEASDHELDGTYTEAELEAYNFTGAMPLTRAQSRRIAKGF